MKSNMVLWFEIPVNNMERAIAFYEQVFDVKLTRQQMEEVDMAMFPFAGENTTGASGTLIANAEYYEPGQQGVQVYFCSLAGDIAIELGRVEKAGGTLLKEKTLISEEVGSHGLFLDSEGNRIAMYGK